MLSKNIERLVLNYPYHMILCILFIIIAVTGVYRSNTSLSLIKEYMNKTLASILLPVYDPILVPNSLLDILQFY